MTSQEGRTATVSVLDLGYYEAGRAAALSGVPVRTLYHWSRTGLVVPSVSAEREKLWSYADLLKIRLVRWLRTDKDEIAASTMTHVRRAIDQLGDALWDRSGTVPSPTVRVDRAGKIFTLGEDPADLDGQLLATTVDLFGPSDSGVDLRQPRPHIRIHPGRVSGEPHLVHSRLTTRAVAGLASRGLSIELICELYPGEDPIALEEAVDLETSLGTLAVAA